MRILIGQLSGRVSVYLFAIILVPARVYLKYYGTPQSPIARFVLGNKVMVHSQQHLTARDMHKLLHNSRQYAECRSGEGLNLLLQDSLRYNVS